MDDWQSFFEKISDIKFTMLITHDADGEMQARPFTTQAAGREGAVWFFARTDTAAVRDIGTSDKVLLCYTDTEKGRFIAAAGRATLSHDRALIEEFWEPAYQTFFPQGIDDPALVLLRIAIDHADIWNPQQSAMQQLISVTKSALGMKIDKEQLSGHQELK
ncbi:general stress protein 26 [Actimicrobium sp. GrIS 1.19]|uniref:pyridoxamine 5'-phosphate oxidase family protein n=1 Tax=Actimicrobium sp. GrIS 1.19 TaxID=3071708 RepID=UPI002DFF65C8|nr:general stress protein 26 [Actimicrobium sp. GrIS 1.19]